MSCSSCGSPSHSAAACAHSQRSNMPSPPSGCAVLLWSVPVGIVLLVIGLITANVGPISLPSLPSFSKKEERAATYRALLGRWDGHRTCGGRRYGLRLELKRSQTGEPWLNGTATLFQGGDAKGATAGTFFIGGEYSGEKLELDPTIWKGGGAPSGHVTFALRADVPYGTPSALSGKLEETRSPGPGCTAFKVAKRTGTG